MSHTLARALTALSLAVVVYAAASALVLFEQLGAVAERVWPGTGLWVFFGLLALSLCLLGYVLWQLMRLPRSVQPPTDAAKLPAYQAWLQTHLAQHPDPQVSQLAHNGDVAAALAQLQQQARELTSQTAAGVFISTALIQNGRLDGLVLLASQVRLVWRIAQLYRLRPTPRQLWYLYGNVAGSVLVTSSLEELDFAEIVGPIVGAAAPAMASAVPGMQGISKVLANSLATGAANAFITLRVGLIAQAYCAPLQAPDAAHTRQYATLQAAGLLKDIVAAQGKRVVRSVWGAAGHAVTSTVGAAADSIKRASSASSQAVGQAVDSTGALLRRSGDAITGSVQDSSDAVARAVQQARQRWRKGDDAAPPTPRP